MSRGLDLFIDLAKNMADYPDLTPDRVLIIDMDKETFERILSPGRLELIRTINKKKPKSVGELARLMNKPVESVSRDLKILMNSGILELVQVGRMKKPVIEKDMILVPLTT